MTAVPATALPETLPETMPVRALLVGERLDTRGLERRESLATAPLTLRLPQGGIAVLFRYGVVVLFDAPPAAEEGLLQKVAPLVVGAFAARETDDARLQISRDLDEQIDVSGTIFLKQASTLRLQLVADALAKGLILTHYETRIAGIFDRIEPLAATLREKGRTGAAGADLMRQIGDVLLIQHRMVGRVETGEKPELLWDHPELERLYLRLAEEYELRERSRALDRKLDVISRTVETLLGLVQNRSTLRVEWYILGLIVAEFMLTIYSLLIPR
jgi:required for meiotic nuclear division protein 1